MAKMNGKFSRNVTTVTEGDYNGQPTLAIPGANPAFPTQHTLKKWREVAAHWESHVLPWLKKHENWTEAPKQSKPAATSGDGQVDLSKLDPAIRALVEAALKNSTPVPTPAPAPVKEMTVEERIAALRAKMAAK